MARGVTDELVDVLLDPHRLRVLCEGDGNGRGGQARWLGACFWISQVRRGVRGTGFEGSHLQEVVEDRRGHASVALFMRRRRRVHGARLCTSERERAVDPERPGTAPPGSPIGHRPRAPPPAVLAVVDPAEDRGWTSDAPRGDGVMAIGATERESAGRGGARSALQHRRHSRLSPDCAPWKNKMKKSGLSRNPGHPVVASGVEGRSFAGRMRSRRGREVSLVRSRDSGGHPSEPAQVLNGLHE